MYAEAMAIAREMGDQLTNWDTLHGLAAIEANLGHLDEAIAWDRRALAIAQSASGNYVVETITLCALGIYSGNKGDADRGREYFGEALALCRSLGEQYGVAVILNDLGELEMKAGNLEAAERNMTEALPLMMGAWSRAAWIRTNLMIVKGLKAQRLGEVEAAAQAFEEALGMCEQMDTPDSIEQADYVRQLLADVQQ
jgi:tetratricopeptide (TPR) repeat protein